TSARCCTNPSGTRCGAMCPGRVCSPPRGIPSPVPWPWPSPVPTLHIGLPTSIATRESLAPSPALDHREDLGAGFDAVPVLLCTVRSSAASTNSPVYTVHDRTKEAVNAPAGARRKDRDRRHG